MLHPMSCCEALSREVGPSQSPSERYGEEQTPCVHRESNPAQSVASHFADNYGVERSVALGCDAVSVCGSLMTSQSVVINLQVKRTAHTVMCYHVNLHAVEILRFSLNE
jgi:hypothetical protein